MEPDNKVEPQLPPTLNLKAEGKDKKIDDPEDPIVKAITDTPEEAWKTIRSIKLSCNSYSPAAFAKFAKLVGGAKSIESLDITDCFMGRKKEQMCQAIHNIMVPLEMGNIAELNISNNALGVSCARVFGPFLEKLPFLKRFFIANCGLGGMGAKEILDRLIHCKQLEVFSMGKNRVEIDGGLALADALRFLPNLKTLLFFQNGIRGNAMEAVLDSIQKHLHKLEVLDMSDNFAYGEAVTKLVSILKNKDFQIKALNLSDCIDKDDLKAIIEAIKSAREVPIIERFGLNYVELRSNQLAQTVLDFLEKCPLKYLEVQGTELTKKMRALYQEKLRPKVGELVFEDPQNAEAELVNAFGSMKINDN